MWDSVPRAERFRQRVEARRAFASARPIVDRLFDRGLGPKEVINLLKADDSLSDPIRREALNLVLQRSSSRRTSQPGGPGDARPTSG